MIVKKKLNNPQRGNIYHAATFYCYKKVYGLSPVFLGFLLTLSLLTKVKFPCKSYRAEIS